MARFDDLLEGYRRDDLADAELEEFLALLQADAGPMAAPILEDLRNNTWPGHTDPAQRARMLARVLAGKRHPNKAFVIRLLPRAAAAAILIALIGAAYLWINHPPKTNSTATLVRNDIAPGTNKATLTLSNGATILLDSAANGLIARQGNSTIQKSAGDQLTYKNSSPQSVKSFQSRESWSNTMTTPKGGQYQLVLADGTKVWLNSASSLRYPSAFAANTRSVELSGEAYFEVARDKNSPFIVNIKDVSVKVLGTHFDIMAYSDEAALNTTLLEGSVQVSRTSQSQTLIPGQSRTLIPGQAALVSAADHSITVQPADADKAIAWTTGFFKFDHTDLHSIMREVARWYDVDVVYQTGDNNETYGGRIRRDLNLSVLIKFLEANGIHHFRIDGKKLIVLP